MRRGRRSSIAFVLVLVASMALVVFGSLTAPVAAQTGPPVTGGLVLRLDASDAASITRDGANRVSQWADLSGNNNHATQGTLANQPLWADNVLAGKPAIRFDGIDDRLFFPYPGITSSVTAFVVFQQISVTQRNPQILRGFVDRASKFALQGASDTELTFRPFGVGTSQAQTTALPVGDFYLGTAVYDDASVEVYVDGDLKVSVAQSPVSIQTVDYACIGHDGGTSTEFYFHGDIGEILIYDRALSEAERQSVEQYLGRKWLGWGTACTATATSSGTACLTTSHGVMSDLVGISAPGLPSVAFPHGMFSFKITGLAAGQSVDVTIELPDPVPVGTVWWKHDNGRWYSLPNRNDNGNNIMVIRLTDGGTGDLDNVPGQITDPGGPGNPMTVGWEGSPIGKASLLTPWVALLAAIMAGTSLFVLRRQRAVI